VLRLGLLWTLNVLFLLIFGFPFYWLTITAFKTPAEADTLPIGWLPSHLYWGNFRAILANAEFQHAFLNSAIVATTTTALALVVGSCAAYALARLPLPRKRSILVGAVLGVAIPPIALVPSLYLELRQLGWLDTYLALIAGDLAFALPFTIWVLSNVFRDIPPQIIEQAEVDGCTPVHALWHVAMPLAIPSLVAAGLLTFIIVWNEFLFAVTFTMSPQMETITVLVVRFGGWSGLAAASELVMVPIIALALIGQRGIVRGLTSGAVNG
jgi:ABC-type glycerol-3-phosphate transport system permease component